MRHSDADIRLTRLTQDGEDRQVTEQRTERMIGLAVSNEEVTIQRSAMEVGQTVRHTTVSDDADEHIHSD
jgi:hypothetical protein